MLIWNGGALTASRANAPAISLPEQDVHPGFAPADGDAWPDRSDMFLPMYVADRAGLAANQAGATSPGCLAHEPDHRDGRLHPDRRCRRAADSAALST